MKKKNIIKKGKEFTDIIHKCPYVKNSYFVIYYKKNSTINRYGITIPTKTGKANIRNKIKRRIKNIIDLNEKYIHISYDYVIIVRKRLLELDYQAIEKNLLSLLSRIGAKNE